MLSKDKVQGVWAFNALAKSSSKNNVSSDLNLFMIIK
jgi:hypothetical protein